MLKPIRNLLSAILAVILMLTVSVPVYSETTPDFEALFQEMDIETLEETGSLLQRILNEKKIAGASLFLTLSGSDLAVGQNMKLTVSSDGREITSKTKVSFESSDESIAVVKNGVVLGKAPGTAVITATALFEDGAELKATNTLNVIVPVASIKANSKNAIVLVGSKLDIAALVAVSPEDASEKGLIYAVDDDSIASISKDGVLSGIKPGSVNVSITSAEKTDTPKSASIAVSVNQPVAGILLSESKFDVGNGNNFQLQASVSPDDATNRDVVWESADPKVATVSKNGTVTGVGTGTTSIICTASDGSGITASAEVTVITAVKRLSVDKKEIIITKGNETPVNITVTPENPTNKTLDWSSSNQSVAEVSSDGVITAVDEGECTITAVTTDGTGISVSIPVYVEPRNPVVIESISWRTSWGRRTGKMAVYATNKCKKRTIKSFEYTVFCVKGTEYFGNVPVRNGWTTDLKFSKQVRPGQKLEGKMENVSGFAAVDEVEITPTKVYFTDGTVEEIPYDAQYTSTFTVY